MSVWTFGTCRFDDDAGQLLRDGEPQSVQPLVLDALVLFLEQPDKVITKETLLQALWPDVQVTEQSLTQVVRRLRVAIGDVDRPYRMVETVHRRGYRWTLPSQRVEGTTSSPSPAIPVADLVGRQVELDQLEAWSTTPLVSILGPGGVGKTTLLRAWISQRAPGAVWVDLSACRDRADILLAVASALLMTELADDPDQALAQLGSALAHRGQLLALDNAETAMPDVADVVTAWTAAGVCIRITTRIRLRLRHEHTLDLGPLPSDEAITLLLRRARSVSPGFDAEPAVLAELVARLDGLPLALELAAARTRILDAQSLLDGLHDRFALLGTGSRDHSARHQTLEATVAWSWDLLDDAGRAGLAALAVVGVPMHGEIAAACAGGLDQVEDLLDRSLLSRVEPTAGHSALALLETVREFVVDQQPAAPDAERRFVEATTARITRLRDRGSPRAALLWAELPALTTALERALERGWVAEALRLGALFDRWAYERVPFPMYEKLVRAAGAVAERPESPDDLAVPVLDALAGLYYERSRFDDAAEVATGGLARAEAVGDREGQSAAHQILAMCASASAGFDGSWAHLDAARALAPPGSITELRLIHATASVSIRARTHSEHRALIRHGAASAPHDEVVRRTRALHDAAVAEILLGDFRAAEPLLEQAEAMAEEFGSISTATLPGTRALLLANNGRFDEAVECIDRAIEGVRRMGITFRRATLISNAGLMHLYAGHEVDARSLLEEAWAMDTDNGWTEVGLALLDLDDDPDGAIDRLAQARSKLDDVREQYTAHLFEACAHCLAGRPDVAEALVVAPGDLATLPGSVPLRQLEARQTLAGAAIAWARGDLELARTRHSEADGAARRILTVAWLHRRVGAELA